MRVFRPARAADRSAAFTCEGRDVKNKNSGSLDLYDTGSDILPGDCLDVLRDTPADSVVQKSIRNSLKSRTSTTR